MSDKGIIDIHSHSVMTHYRNKRSGVPACKEIIKEVWPLVDKIMGNQTFRSYNTQADFGKLANNDVLAIIISLYPLERKWFMPKLSNGNLMIELISNITGYSKSNIRKLTAEEPINYFADLIGEYEYLKEQIKKQCNGKNFKIAVDYDDFARNLQSGNTVSIILSIEGASSLGSNIPEKFLEKRPSKVMVSDYNKFYRDNVFKMKSWGPNNDSTHSPFIIGLSHHFWNMLCGHCESLPFFFNQRVGKESGITPAGWKMIEDLLSTNDKNGVPNKTRRILIDVKHMSPKARKSYYEYLENKNLKVPIIFSHAAVGDAPSLDSFIRKTEDHKRFKNPKNYFNTSTLSLNDEDIKQVIKTDGIIGIVLHEGRIASNKAMKGKAYGVKNNKKLIDNLEQEIKDLETRKRRTGNVTKKNRLMRKINNRLIKIGKAKEQIKHAYVCMIMANIFRVVETTYKMDNNYQGKGWDHVCIGSDYDGMINKLDYLGTANEFPELRERFLKFLKQPEPLLGFDESWTTKKLKDLQFGISPDKLIEMFFSENVKSFFKKFYNVNYLIKKSN